MLPPERRNTELRAVKYTFPERSVATRPGNPTATLVPDAAAGAGAPPATVEIVKVCAQAVPICAHTANPQKSLILSLLCSLQAARNQVPLGWASFSKPLDAAKCTRVPL